jgi:hypothetical protein
MNSSMDDLNKKSPLLYFSSSISLLKEGVGYLFYSVGEILVTLSLAAGISSKTVVHGNSYLFSRIYRSPPIALAITFEQVSPTPMFLSFTKWIDFFMLSSPKIFIMFEILSAEISWPVFMIFVLKMY